MLMFLMLMSAGIYAAERGWLTKESDKDISAIVVNIANPALILSGAVSVKQKMSGREFLTCFAEAGFVYLILIAVGIIYSIIYQKNKNEKELKKKAHILQMLIVFSNLGFMGLPLTKAIAGNDAVIYMNIYILWFDLLFYTYGAWIIERKFRIKQIFSAGVIASLISVVIYFCPMDIPGVLKELIDIVSGMSTPLSMMVIGASLLNVSWKKELKKQSSLIFLVFRMLILPAAIILIVRRLFDSNHDFMIVTMIAVSAPAAGMTAMAAMQHGKDEADDASAKIAETTILSVLTIPLMAMLV